MNICFLDNNNLSYDHNSLNDKNIRGAEKTIINLSLKLSKLGHKITILNHTKKNIKYENTRWINILNYKDDTNYDLAITNNDINNFNFIKAKKKIAISYSVQTLEKFIRKKQLFPFLKHKPKIFLIGKYHLKKRSYFTRMFGSNVINLAVDDEFIKTELTSKIDNKKAIFTSYPDRNLKTLINIWINHIHTINTDLKLYISPMVTNYEKYNIFNRHLLNRENFINELLNSRVYLVPGHKAELFCIAAEEARELCIPTVTLGIGALSERVVHNKTGFIAKNEKDFAKYTLELFNNDSLWNEIRANLKSMRNSKNWDQATKDFLTKCE